MRSIHNYVQAVKARREENGDEGFSLIELIVVVVILGILAAIAIPVFAGLQDQAKQQSLETIAANGATAVASQVASVTDATELTAAITKELGQLAKDDVTVAQMGTGNPTIETICVVAYTGTKPTAVAASSKTAAFAGPGCIIP
ncbi:type II secretion system protein [Microbacterium invictum]|uniref:Prepilin-type N-terminal cleavage/methylation domain-containing protein n=1 Tax=Microbacterium invictum TaxID=515415 RepID=A0AA40SNE2_9MICO|nr:prepilin-type N-terminal cleavage/methylation domain-containing protein [Microbacterium invictum]MBB4139430.1 prepilin-type N-terminal cleavage/methylation domain-containing protein [Microbacterium invictum]